MLTIFVAMSSCSCAFAVDGYYDMEDLGEVLPGSFDPRYNPKPPEWINLYEHAVTIVVAKSKIKILCCITHFKLLPH